jgi:hypothetical protein
VRPIPPGILHEIPQEVSGLEDGWELLIQAVVLQAAEDYRLARQVLRRRPDRETARLMVRDVERFFRSEWFTRITGLDGRTILEKLKGEEKDDRPGIPQPGIPAGAAYRQ